MARPHKPIDWELVDQLLEANCHGTEICTYFDMHYSTFYDRVKEKYGINFTEYSQEKKQKGDSIIRKVQYDKAINGDNMMLIWLGKNRLGQRDKEEKSENHELLETVRKIIADIKNTDNHVVE